VHVVLRYSVTIACFSVKQYLLTLIFLTLCVIGVKGVQSGAPSRGAPKGFLTKGVMWGVFDQGGYLGVF